MPINTVSQRLVAERHAPGKPGMLAFIKDNRILTATNAYPQAPETMTLTVSTFTADATYTYQVEGRAVSYTAVAADATTAGVAAKLAQVHNADPQVRGYVSAEASGSTVILRSLLPGFDFSADESDAKLALAATSPSVEAEAVPFGRVVMVDGGALTARLPIAGDTTAVDTKILGISVFTHDAEEAPEYPANTPMMVLIEGFIFVDYDGAGTLRQKMFLGTSGAERGKLYSATAAGRVVLPNVRLHETFGTLAIVEIFRA